MIKTTIFDRYTLYRDGSVYLGELRLPQYCNANGYLYVKLEGKMYPVHRLVASSFVKKSNDANVVMHLDNNKHHNAAENLMWGTQADNVRHAIATGVHHNIGAWRARR
jgi:hypothetical protein